MLYYIVLHYITLCYATRDLADRARLLDLRGRGAAGAELQEGELLVSALYQIVYIYIYTYICIDIYSVLELVSLVLVL